MISVAIKSIAIVALLLVLSGCSSISYYGQSVIGHTRLMLARQSINGMLKDEALDASLRLELNLAKELRAFSISHLALPDNGSYSSYVELDREFPVWTVVAANEFSVIPSSWCYPIIGCASYRGYFSEHDAHEFAAELQNKNLETSVGGAGAYSTLGWFDDPIVPSMVRYGVEGFAETLFHELAHQVIYVKNNTEFNEAFATVVGEQGALIWLANNRPELLVGYQEKMRARNAFTILLFETKQALDELYMSDLSDEVKRSKKSEVLNEMRREYSQIKQSQWQGKPWFDTWFDTPVNNARLAGIGAYRDLVPEFELLLRACDMSFSRFYAAVKTMKNQHENASVPKECSSFLR